MLAQTTDSGSSNPVLAKELETMFMDCDDPVFWDSSRNQIRCYCHKLALIVKAGLATMGLDDHGRTKPTIPSGKRLRLLLPDDHIASSKIVMADGTLVDEDGDLIDCDSDQEDVSALEEGEDMEASDDSEDEDDAPDYKLQKSDASLLQRAVTKVMSPPLFMNETPQTDQFVDSSLKVRRINKLITSSAP